MTDHISHFQIIVTPTRIPRTPSLVATAHLHWTYGLFAGEHIHGFEIFERPRLDAKLQPRYTVCVPPAVYVLFQLLEGNGRAMHRLRHQILIAYRQQVHGQAHQTQLTSTIREHLQHRARTLP